ncbi:MAG: rplY [Alphaproteobacteria bacterium]|nr:rplY [Alphaproteobacteria bacterium]
MSQIQELKAEARTGTGKGPAYQARLKGLVPGVIYGGNDTPENVAVDARTLERIVDAGHFLTTLFSLDIGGKKTRAIPRAVQLDPVTDRVVHVDFLRLAEGGTVRLAIPVHFHGQDVSPGLKKGGVLNVVRHNIVLICPADSIPNTIDVDVSALDINETVHIADLALPEGVKVIIKGRDTTVCSIVASTSVREEQKAAASTADAPAAEAAPAAAAAAPAAGAKAPAAGAKAPAAAAAKPAAKK